MKSTPENITSYKELNDPNIIYIYYLLYHYIYILYIILLFIIYIDIIYIIYINDFLLGNMFTQNSSPEHITLGPFTVIF